MEGEAAVCRCVCVRGAGVGGVVADPKDEGKHAHQSQTEVFGAFRLFFLNARFCSFSRAPLHCLFRARARSGEPV